MSRSRLKHRKMKATFRASERTRMIRKWNQAFRDIAAGFRSISEALKPALEGLSRVFGGQPRQDRLTLAR